MTALVIFLIIIAVGLFAILCYSLYWWKRTIDLLDDVLTELELELDADLP